MWQLNDKHGLRSGPNSANEAKPPNQTNKGATEHQTKKTQQKNEKQEQATSELCRKVAEIPPRERQEFAQL